MDGQDAVREALTRIPGDRTAGIDHPHVIPGVTAYAVRSADGDALQFSIPVLVRRPLFSEIPLDPRGSAGAVALMIERIKQKAGHDPALGPLAAKGTRYPGKYAATVEPYTLVSSPDALASDLWHADARNSADAGGIHLVLRGVVPFPATASPEAGARVTESAAALLDAVARIVCAFPLRALEDAWIATLDQELVREQLPDLGLVAFAGDGARCARACTQYRCYYRTAGPKAGTNIPFTCPVELAPEEIELPASNRVITGLGIRRREVFAVAGSNAQGKTTFLEGILAGVDTHAPGDGREYVVTVPGIRTAEAMNCELAGSDISMFFSALPPGIGGTVRSAYGMGSGSMTMAAQVQRACSRGAPLLILDEDRAAPNLLVKSCLQSEDVTPLSELLARHRHKIGDTTLLFAACAMDTLVAQADRIMVLDRHVAVAVDRDQFVSLLKGSLKKTAEQL